MAVSKRLRYEVLRRDNHQCRYCGSAAPDVKLTVDHVLPVALGGADEASNLVAACADCNSGKSASAPDAALVDQVNEHYLQWRDAMQFAFEIDNATRELRDQHREAFRSAWCSWTYTYRGEPKTFELPLDWPGTVDRFIRAGLQDEDLEDAVDEAMRRSFIKDRFAYFCGVCWNVVRQRQEFAVAYLSTDGPADGS